MLGGVFGYGLKRNVLDIYKYACRNYKPGDDIYAFGFSRGAFTIRLVVALIAAEGLVQSDDESELDRHAQAAYRAFRRPWLPRRLEWPTKLFRRDPRRVHSGRPTTRRATRRPTIAFVGVWDTVSAYGGPIAETDARHRQLDLRPQHARLRAEPEGPVRAARAGARRRA